MLQDFGSYRVGGRTHTVEGEPVREVAFTATTRYPYDPNGDYAVEAAYVQYFVPEPRNDEPPVVLLHGGGMTGAMWETTPDGRPGWLHLLLRAGFEVHVIDNVERGRAGWMPGLWQGEPFLRAMQEAWTLFRFGRAEGFDERIAFDGQQFPVGHLEELAKGFVPRWSSTTARQVDALVALLRRLDRASVIAHSQGGEVAFRAACRVPDAVHRLVAIEPSGFPEVAASMRTVPVTIAFGDYLESAELWCILRRKWSAFATDLEKAGGRAALIDLAAVASGASHFPMMDRSSEAYLDAIARALL